MSFSDINNWSQLLLNKVVFITGAGGHIAKYILKTCYAQGARLVLGDLDPALIDGVLSELKIKEDLNEDRILVVTLDITNESNIQQAVRKTLEKWQTIDVLFNVAVYYQHGNVEEVSAETWSRVFDVNVRGYALMVKHIVPIMKKQKSGSIVNFASTLGLIAIYNAAPYSASKAAILQLTRNLAADLGLFNVRVNSISPSLVNLSVIHEHAEKLGTTEEQLKGFCISAGCIKRLLEPQEVANLAVFLASDLCPFMTGTNLVVDGGGSIM